MRETIPKAELASIVDIIGLPYSGLNTLVQQHRRGQRLPTATSPFRSPKSTTPPTAMSSSCEASLARSFPGVTEFYQLPVDMTTQILNFGLPAPLDVQVIGQNLQANHAFATR